MKRIFVQKKIILPLSVFLLLALTAITSHYQLIFQDPDKPKAQKVSGIFSKPFHDIAEFRYTRSKNTRRMYSIQADRFRVQKKKMGLMRFALIKEIIVDNAEIDFYKPSDQKINFQILTQDLKDSKTTGGMIPKSTGKVIFSPVILQILSQEGQVLSRICAGSATFNLKNKQIVFDRNVQIHSGNRILNAASLTVISKEGQLIARQNVILKTPSRTITRDVLETDMFLTQYH